MEIVTAKPASVRAGSAESETAWQAAMRQAIRDPAELCRVLQLPDEIARQATAAAGGFPLFAPRSYVAKIRPADPHDPLLRQILPVAEETSDAKGFSRDAVRDGDAGLAPGLIKKYHGRALLIATGVCAVHCRYCFRRHFPYAQAPRSLAAWQPALEQIAADESIEEVLLSGGDPLTLGDERLRRLIDEIEAVDHVRRLRIHTRLPLMIPLRITRELVERLTQSRLTPIVVIHANHPRELGEAEVDAIARLVDAGIVVLNQSVLLAGVNDSVEPLEQLSRRLADARVMPYYLHQLDRVAGAAHFEVPIKRGIELIEQLQRRLPGYAVPRYVQEVAGEAGKKVLA